MDNFYKYRPKTKKKETQKCMCPQTMCTQNEVLKIRINSELKNKIKEVSEEKGMSISEMTRILWEDYLQKKSQIEWQKEVAEY